MERICNFDNLFHKEKEDNTIYLIYSIFTILLFVSINFFNVIKSKEILQSSFFYCGTTIFFIHFIKLKLKFTFTTLIIIFTVAFLNRYYLIIIGIIGYFLFFKDIFFQRYHVVYFVVSIFGIIIISGHIFGNSQCDPFYIYTLLNKRANCDLYFHSTLAANYKNFGYCTTALHGAPKFEYWSLTNLIASKLSNHFNIRSLDFYNIIFPGIIWGKVLFLLHFVIKISFDSLNKIKSNQLIINSLISFLMINVISMLVFKPTWGPIQNYFKWEIYSVFSVPLSLVFIMTFFLATLEIFKIKNKVLKYILFSSITVFGFSLIFNLKIYLAHYIIGTTLLMIFRKQSIIERNFCTLAFLLSLIIYIYYHTNSYMVKNAFVISFMDIWNRMLTISQILWSIFSFTFIPLVIIFLIKGNFVIRKNIISIQSFRNNFIIFLIVFLFLLSFSPSIFFGGSHVWNLLYYIDTFYILMCFPLTLYLTLYIQGEFRSKIRFSFILLILFISITMLTGIGSGIVSFKEKFYKKNKLEENFSEIANSNYSHEKDQVFQLTSTLTEIFYKKLDNSVLWVPYTNEIAWNSFNMNFNYGVPFVFTAITELPLIYGFPKVENSILQNVMFGYDSYSHFPINYTDTLENVTNVAKSQGYKNLYVLEDFESFSHHRLQD